MKRKTSILPQQEILQLIEEVRNTELSRDIDSMRGALERIWDDFDQMPDFSLYDNQVKGELLRIAGVFLSFYGQARNKNNYQVKGKDLLTKAIEVFEAQKLTEKAIEAKVMLAHCYWNGGEIEECEAILDHVEAEFGENLLHPVYLKICINRLLIYWWKKDYDSGFEIINRIKSAMQFCDDYRMQAMFHNQAGLFFRTLKNYDKAIFHLYEAIRFAGKANNRVFIAINYNNLAYLFKENQNYEEAVRCVSLAIEIFCEINHYGFLAHALDTKSLIYFNLNKLSIALETINQAIEIFREGEDAAGLTDALWTQVRCLLRLKRKEQALIVFNELLDIARTRIGETAVQKFTRALSDEIYVLRDLPLMDEVQQFKKERVRAALIQAKGKISKAAMLLHLKSHQVLSDILNNQFPTLYEELGFRRRAARKAKQQNGGESRTVTVSSENILEEAEISQLALPDKDFAFAFPCRVEEFKTFYFDRFMMKKFGIEAGAIVAVVAVAEIKEGILLLMSDENDFKLAKAEYDAWTKVFYITDERGEPLPLETEQVVGEPVGYCLIKDADNKFIEFSRLLL